MIRACRGIESLRRWRPCMKLSINTIAVIGAGARGRSIAWLCVAGGYRTILEDVFPRTLEEGIAWVRARLEQSRGTQQNEKNGFGRTPGEIVGAGSVEDAIREADLVIEAVAEEMEAKIELFTIFDKFAKPNAILASSSPALSIAEMAEVTYCAERCIGMRFGEESGDSLPVELVTTRETSRETLEACGEVVRRMGREAVVAAEFEDDSKRMQSKRSAAQN